MDIHPQTTSEFVDAVRSSLTCERCGKYVGALAKRRYLPAPYPVAVDKLGPGDEAEVLVSFEWHMAGLMKRGTFVIRHPELDGHCVTYREWVASDDEESEADE